MRSIHSSSSAGGRAFSAGNDPTMPALHWAMTSSGTEMMNKGAPITGKDRRPLNKAGMDIVETLRDAGGAIRRETRRSKATTAHACKLLAQRAGDVIFRPAVARLLVAARQQGGRRAGLRLIGIEALAFLEALGLAKLVGG